MKPLVEVRGCFQALHALEVTISRGAEGKTGRAFVGTLTEERALESAGKIASESFIFAVSFASCPQNA